MPSSHSALVSELVEGCALKCSDSRSTFMTKVMGLTTAVGYANGTGSVVFAISIVFSVIVSIALCFRTR